MQEVLETASSALGSQEPAGQTPQMMSGSLAGAMIGGPQLNSAILSHQAEPTVAQLCEMPIEVLRRTEAGTLGTERGGAGDAKDDFSSDLDKLLQQADELASELLAIAPPVIATTEQPAMVENLDAEEQQLDESRERLNAKLLAVGLSSAVQVISTCFQHYTLKTACFASAR